VDDADVLHIDMEAEESIKDTHLELQESISNWGNLLIALGGALKPIKCFYHLISFGWKADGSWRYSTNECNEELDIVVPMPGRTEAKIEHVLVNQASKTLGVMTCPSGAHVGALQRMKDRAQEWVDLIKKGKMLHRHV